MQPLIDTAASPAKPHDACLPTRARPRPLGGAVGDRIPVLCPPTGAWTLFPYSPAACGMLTLSST